MKTGQGKLSERLRNAPQLLADEQYLQWVIEQVEELEKLELKMPFVTGNPEGHEWANQFMKPGRVQLVPKNPMSVQPPLLYKE